MEKLISVLKDPWVIIGFVGQFLFMMRFVVQWIHSEKQRKSVIPNAFWFFSIGGGLVLLAYAISRHDPVFIAGQALGLTIYCRNIYFVIINKKNPKKTLDAHKVKHIADKLAKEFPNNSAVADLQALL